MPGIAEIERQLFRFESIDPVVELFMRMHGEAPTPERAKDIVARVKQGRQFLTIATTSAELVRPLIFYYGVLALARAAILMANGTLHRHHGLSAHSWDSAFSRGVRGLAELRIVAKGQGTFAELTQITRNTSTVAAVLIDNLPRRALANLGRISETRTFQWEVAGTPSITQDVTISLRDVLARMPDLQWHFNNAFGSTNDAYSAVGLVLNDQMSTVSIELPVDVGLAFEAGGNHWEEALRRYDLPPDTSPEKLPMPLIRFSMDPGRQYPGTGYWVSIPAGPPLRVPSIKGDMSGSPFMVSGLPGGLYLSTLSLLYIVSYTMGMLVRYYPAVMVSLQSGEEGDAAYPIMRAALALAEEQLPQLLVTALQSMVWKRPS